MSVQSNLPSVNRQTPPLGIPLWTVLGLALLAVPRVVVHDLGVDVPTAVLALLTFGPPLVWIAVALRARVKSPLITLVAIGASYGLFLGISHNLMWNEAFGENRPTLGGNLNVDGPLADLIFRSSTMISSLLTGSAVGLIAGVVAIFIRKVAKRG